MKALILRLWNEPALALSALAAGVQLAVFLPDWRAGLVAAVQLVAGVSIRQRVTPSGR
jgi:hypothetical protein